ncbi:hypothetical protein NY08_4320 [Rhodococcus sp. B7740]|uniref:DUF3237 domain-containing protein n=1 Tax=Rhodococcus sp. B7740 TaxID=1564114 RepID=UPI0005D9B2A7|nr:DUF3237 domain-containing protein [Rhodococcus sp. B7740]AJW42322.1 hypothetical protein NY08_4320 [Rhodococcus sp. B7740]
MSTPTLHHVFTLDVELAPPVVIGSTPHGMRRVIPITGGRFRGPAGSGTILPGGADWNLVRTDGVTHLWARYTIVTDDDVTIMVTNEGWGTQDDATMERIFAGGGADIDRWYCSTNPRFEVADPGWKWLNHSVFLGHLEPPTRGDRVRITVYTDAIVPTPSTPRKADH